LETQPRQHRSYHLQLLAHAYVNHFRLVTIRMTSSIVSTVPSRGESTIVKACTGERPSYQGSELSTSSHRGGRNRTLDAPRLLVSACSSAFPNPPKAPRIEGGTLPTIRWSGLA